MDFTPLLDPSGAHRQQAAELLRGRSLMVVSGHRLLISLLTGVASQSCHWFGATTCEPEALRLLRGGRPDLLLVLDPLEAGCALSLLREAKRLHPTLPCLLLLQKETPQRLLAALESGCEGICLERRVGFGHLVAATKAVLGGGFYLDAPLAPLLRRSSRGQTERAPLALSSRERDVLDLLVQGCPNAEIGQRLHLSVETVRSHMKSLQHKLNARDRTHAAVIGVRLDLVRTDPDLDPGPDPAQGRRQ